METPAAAGTRAGVVLSRDLDAMPGWAINVALKRNSRSVWTCTRLEFEPVTDEATDRGLSTTLLQEVKIGAVLDGARAKADERAEIQQDDAHLRDLERYSWTSKGRRGHPPTVYAWVAVAYLVLCANRVADPVDQLAEIMK